MWTDVSFHGISGFCLLHGGVVQSIVPHTIEIEDVTDSKRQDRYYYPENDMPDIAEHVDVTAHGSLNTIMINQHGSVDYEFREGVGYKEYGNAEGDNDKYQPDYQVPENIKNTYISF
ncbi:MAG: hypothetical protein LAT62_11600 [Natronospirillum sp.]|nr:hypothetical protein [Natronospirillum sp.]MCH8552575.1 hypothetical protein [Natronospirillum sp.]